MTGDRWHPQAFRVRSTDNPLWERHKQRGYPIRVCELLSTLDGVALAQRVTVDSVRNVRIAKKAIKKAFENQIKGLGFSIVEVVSSCPTNWGMAPNEALKWLQDNMLPYYPLGVYKDISEGGENK